MQKEVKMKFSSTQYLYFDYYDMLSIVTSESSVNFIFIKSQIYTEEENFCTSVDKEFFILALKNMSICIKKKVQNIQNL